MPPRHVLVIGGGLGGLCLAHRLRQAGLSVAVYERDRTPDDRWQGYRLHLSPSGSQALHDCLPPELYAAFAATCGQASTRFSFYTEQLHELLSVRFDERSAPEEVQSHKSVSRAVLRRVLLAGLDDVVHFAKVFTRYALLSDGRPRAVFEDGTSAEGDVLVGADGVGSRVRRQYLPRAQVLHTGVVSIGGRAPLGDALRQQLPAPIVHGPAAISAAGGRGLFLAVQQFRRAPPPGTPDWVRRLLDDAQDSLTWGLTLPAAGLPLAEAEVQRLPGSALRYLALGLLSGWHPALRGLVAATDPSTISFRAIRSSVPIPVWPTTRVTLLGDAIHSMTPSRGIGANVALRDAALLGHRLATAGDGEAALLEAIGGYEAQMVTYGFAAVRSSLAALQTAARLDRPLALALARGALRVINAVPPVRQRVFGRLGDA